MKKIMMALAALLIFSASAAAQEVPVDIRVNGEYIKTASEPILIGGTTFAPLRSVAEALCADRIGWSSEQKKADVSIDGTEISVFAGSDSAFIGGNPISLGAASFISSDRIYIPVRSIAELFGAWVSWDGEYKNVEINKDGVTVSPDATDSSFSHDELYWMSRIIKAESCGESLVGKIAVGDVILNRVYSNLFPNTIYDVIFDSRYSIQFEPVQNGSIYNQPCEESIAAAKLSMTNSSSIGNCLYFFNPKIASSTWISKNRIYFTTIGGHDFYL